MRKLICLLMVLCCLPIAAQAAAGMSIVPREMGFEYDITGAGEWIRLIWKSTNDRGMKTMYSPDWSCPTARPADATPSRWRT